MGASHSDIQSDDLFKEFRKEEWRKQKDLGLYELWQNIKTGQLCEAYKLDYVPQQEDLEHYRFRHYNQNADNFVQIRYVDIEKNRSFCYHGESYVLTEFIPVKLTEMHDLSHNEGYSILRSSYRAFHTMEAFHGPFIPDEDLIGINLNGRPKIWLNKNHSKNKADQVIKAQIWQKHMGEVSQNVKRIFEMIEQKLKGKRFPTEFRDYFYNNVMNFSQASQFVQEFCEQHRIIIPHAIQYKHFLEDSDTAKIVNEYNLKRSLTPLNEKLNTLESTYEHEKLVRQDSAKLLARNESHQNFASPQNLHFQKCSVGYVPVLTHPNTNFIPVHRTVFSPVVQRANQTRFVIPPRSVQVQNSQRESRVLSPQIVIPAYQGSLRSTVSVIPVPLQKQEPQSPKPIIYQNMKTPAHVTGNYAFVAPNKIVEFQLPVREHIQAVQSQQPKPIQLSESKKAQSIHEKIKDLQKQDHDYLNESINDDEPEQQTRQQQQKLNEQLHKYINDDSEYNPQQSQQQQQQNITSQPDWETIQHQNQQNHYHNHQQNQGHYYEQQDQHHYLNQSEEDVQPHLTGSRQQSQQNHHHNHHQQYDQYTYEPQQHHVDQQEEQYQYNYPTQNRQYHHQEHHPQNTEQKHEDISPIKQSHSKNTQQFENHYAMFAKYSQLNHHDQYPQQAHHQEQQQERNVNNSFQPRNINLNQSQTLSDLQPDHSSHIQFQETNNEQSLTNQQQQQQTSVLESSQRMRHNSSKNTSNRNGQSSNTLVIHDSQENLYQGVNNEERNYKIRNSCIQQDSQESDNDQQLNQAEIRKQMMNGLLNDQYEENQENQENQERFEEVQVRPLQLNNENNHWQQRNIDYDQVQQSIEDDTQQQQTPVLPKFQSAPNQYNGLHFRNQSDELYQYTPVQSVYKTESGQNFYSSFSRNQQPSGVQQIVQLEKHQDIQEYIRNKYSTFIGVNPQPVVKKQHMNRQRSLQNYGTRAMTFAKPFEPERNSQTQVQTKQYDEPIEELPQNRYDVQRIDSLYEKIDQYDSHITHMQKRNSDAQQSEGNDFLDVGNLEKSLDQKYKHLADQNRIHVSSPKNSHNIKGSQTMSEEDGMNVAALEQRLLKFEERQSIEREKSQRKIQTQNDESSVTHHNDNNGLNFNELDNIVELMDKKIQQSQKKQYNKSSQDLRGDHHISEFAHRQGNIDPLENVQLQTSINNLNNKEISLKDIPILAKDGVSNASNTKRDYYKKYGIDSEDFATGRASASNDYAGSINKQSYTMKKKTSRTYEKKYDVLTPVIQIDRTYENYSSKNLSSYNYELPTLNAESNYDATEVKRKSSRRSSRNVEEANRLVDQLSSKYDKYMRSDTSSNYQIDRPFAKKTYTLQAEPYDSYKNQAYNYSESSKSISNSSKYINEEQKYISNNSRVSARDIQRKKSSYLVPIQQLHGQNYTSPLKESNNYQSSQQNNLRLSNEISRNGSKTNLGGQKSGRNSKVSYDQLRDLLWK